MGKNYGDLNASLSEFSVIESNITEEKILNASLKIKNDCNLFLKSDLTLIYVPAPKKHPIKNPIMSKSYYINKT